jgi:hypothetical protein
MSNIPHRIEGQDAFVKVVKEGDNFEHTPWRLWINCKNEKQEILHGLALHRWVRSRGGVARDEDLRVTVYSYTDDHPKHPNGNPMCCESTTYRLSGKDVVEREKLQLEGSDAREKN